MSARWTAAAIALAGLAFASAIAGAEEQRVQSVGVSPITDSDPTPRDSALRAAVQSAVTGAAAAMLPTSFTPPAPPSDGGDAEPNAWLSEKLGDDPFSYVTRFRILEDRGRRPAMFSSDPGVEFEYVVLAEVTLDQDAIRERLEKLGWVQSGARGSGQRVTLVIDGLSSYQPLAMLRKTLASDRGVRSVVPVEFTDRRAVLSVECDRDAGRLAADLTRRAPEGLQIVTVDQGPTTATLVVEWKPPAPESAPTTGQEPASD